MDTDRSSRSPSSIAPRGHQLVEEQLTRRILRVFYDVYNELGPGFLESVYCNALEMAFAEAGLAAVREAPLPVRFRGAVVGEFRADFVVMSRVIIEVKATRLNSSHLVSS